MHADNRLPSDSFPQPGKPSPPRFAAVPVQNPAPEIYVQQFDLYRAAAERAARDLEMDRLFNGDFYEI